MKNSQLLASNVIVYITSNRPMTMTFWCAGRPDELTLDREMYYRTNNEDFQFQCMDIWLTVLDPIVDLLLCHDVKFKDKHQDDVEGYHVAWIMRWLGQPQDFFVETSGMHRTQDMLYRQGNRQRVDGMLHKRYLAVMYINYMVEQMKCWHMIQL